MICSVGYWVTELRLRFAVGQVIKLITLECIRCAFIALAAIHSHAHETSSQLGLETIDMIFRLALKRSNDS